MLKIETPLAVKNLPQPMLAACGPSDRRDDRARRPRREIGFARLSEMQEEILWLCEAAQVPVVWATQVLDQFVRDGVPIRAEMSDAAMAQSAEA